MAKIGLTRRCSVRECAGSSQERDMHGASARTEQGFGAHCRREGGSVGCNGRLTYRVNTSFFTPSQTGEAPRATTSLSSLDDDGTTAPAGPPVAPPRRLQLALAQHRPAWGSLFRAVSCRGGAARAPDRPTPRGCKCRRLGVRASCERLWDDLRTLLGVIKI